MGCEPFGSPEMSDSDESCDLFERSVGDGTFALHTGLPEDEYSQLFDEVLPLPAGRHPSALSLTDHTSSWSRPWSGS